MQDLTVTIIQADLVWENTEANLARFEQKFKQIKSGTDLVILPEMFNTGFSIKSDDHAQTMDGTAFRWMLQKSSELNVSLTGSILIKDKGQLFNRLFFVQPNGFYTTYDKRHLFRFAGEHKILSQGSVRVIVELKGWKIMPLICYDLRFPVWCKNRSVDETAEYDLLLYVANWPEARKYAWKHLLIARAIENQSFCIGVNRVGTDGYGHQHSGDSVVIDPKGQIMTQGNPFKEEIITSNLRYEELSTYRKAFPVGFDWDEFDIKR